MEISSIEDLFLFNVCLHWSHGNALINNFYIWQEEIMKRNKWIKFMDLRDKLNKNIKILESIKPFLNYFVHFLYHMYLIKKLWFAMEAYLLLMVLNSVISKIYIDSLNHQKEESCVIYYGQIQLWIQEEPPASEELQWDSDRI